MVAGLIGSHLGIHFHLRVIQYMLMSVEAAGAMPSRAMVLAASVPCLLPVILLTAFPGWQLDRIEPLANPATTYGLQIKADRPIGSPRLVWPRTCRPASSRCQAGRETLGPECRSAAA